jgi:uncharacterized protein (TIGR00255 family)
MKGHRVMVECFSVNRRQAEVVVASPRELAAWEPMVREIVLARVARGRVTVSLEVEERAERPSGINRAKARAYCRELRDVMRELGLSGDPPIELVLAGPGVLGKSGLVRDLRPAMEGALALALDALVAMRETEGRHLQRSMEKDARALVALAKKVRPLAAKGPARLRQALMERLKRARLPVDVLDERVAAEVALLAERTDISEELVRLESHAVQFREKLAAEGPVGRTLEFLVQEMGREWNTVGSKSQSAEISRFVVEAKSLMDKLREQLANIE